MRLALVPKTTEFYELFASAGANLLETAEKTEQYVRDFPSSTVKHADVKELEHVGDKITFDIITLLNTQYVTPFDREDIYELAAKVDDVVDHMEHATDLFGLYNIESPARPALEQCRVLVAAAALLAGALGELKKPVAAARVLGELKSLEDEGDRIERDAIAALFQDERIDPLIVIRWKDVYEALEEAIDACETAGTVIGNIAVKNA